MTEPFSSRWTMRGAREGALATLPLMPGMIAFGMAFGTVAARKGMTMFEAVAMSGFVFSGIAQLIVVESWPQQITAAAVFAAFGATFVICSRFILIGAAMRPILGQMPPAQVYPFLYFVVEPPWLLSLRYQREGGTDPGFVIGSAAMCWIFWTISAAPGHWLASSMDPRMLGLDMAIPAFFVAMMVSLWQGPRQLIGWAVAAVTAIVFERVFGGFWYVAAGAVAGSVAGGFADD